MNVRINLVIIAVFAAGSLTPLTASAQESPGSKAMEERTVPIPTGVSKEFHELIATRQIPPALPVPKTREAWLEVQRTWDANNAEVARDLA